MVKVEKRDKESTENLIRRFNKTLQQSGVLTKARGQRFRHKDKTKNQLIKEAVYKIMMKKEIDKLKKMDKFDEENFKDIKRRILSRKNNQ